MAVTELVKFSITGVVMAGYRIVLSGVVASEVTLPPSPPRCRWRRETICTGLSRPTSSGPITVRAAQLLQHFGRDRRRMERRHDRARSPVPERRQNGYCAIRSAVERHVGRHLAVVFEIDAALVEDVHRLAGPSPRARPADGRRSRTPAAPRAARSRDARATPAASIGDLGEVAAASAFRVTAVSATSTVRPRAQHQRDADHAVAGLGIDARGARPRAPREVARHAGHHAHRHRPAPPCRRAKMVAVLVDHALAVAEQIALALQALVEETAHRSRCGATGAH